MAVDDYFSVVALFIMFRESIEASIICAVVLNALNRSAPHLKSQVWWGVGCGGTLSIIFGVIFIAIYYTAQNNLFQGRNQSIFVGCLSWVASIFITVLAFAMLRFQGWEEKWKRKLAAAAEKLAEETARKQQLQQQPQLQKLPERTSSDEEEGLPDIKQCQLRDKIGDASTIDSSVGFPDDAKSEDIDKAIADTPAATEAFLPGKQRYALFILIFTTVVREGLEAVVFLAGVGNAVPKSLPLPGVVGILCGVAFGMVLYFSGKQVKDLKLVMIIMALVLFFIAAGQFENGAASLMRAGMYGPYFPGSSPPPVAGGATVVISDGDERRRLLVAAPTIFGAPLLPDADTELAIDTGYLGDGTEEDGLVGNLPGGEWFSTRLWDISGCCSDLDSKNKFLSLASKVFGYNSEPTFIDVTFYAGYWIMVLAVGLYKHFKGTLLDADYKYKREMAKKLALEQQERLAAKRKALEAPPPIDPEAALPSPESPVSPASPALPVPPVP